jgi:hypothetical protein
MQAAILTDEACKVALTDGDACFENLQALDRQLARAAREALISGRISWSMAKEIARRATPETEEKLLQLAAHRTVG